MPRETGALLSCKIIIIIIIIVIIIIEIIIIIIIIIIIRATGALLSLKIITIILYHLSIMYPSYHISPNNAQGNRGIAIIIIIITSFMQYIYIVILSSC